MSRTVKGSKAPGWETWSKRPNSFAPPDRVGKKITAHIERQRNKKEAREAKE